MMTLTMLTQVYTLHRFFTLVIVLGLASLFTLPVCAHEIRPAIIDLNINDNADYTMSIRLNIEAIMAEVSPEHSDTDTSPNAQRYNTLRALPPAAVAKAFKQFQTLFLSGLQLQSNLGRLTPSIDKLDIAEVGDITLARDTTIYLSGRLPFNTQSLTWGWQTTFGANALRVSSNTQQDLYTVYLQPGKTSESIVLSGIVKQSSWQIFSNYLVIGYEHIVPKGLDHILFVIGLFLLSLRLAPLLWQITSFTIAHSVTLALGILGIVTIPASIVEPLIALSIVYVCIENMLSDKLHKWRPIIVFSFGLLHGLGFASVLGEIGLNSNHFITGLIAFNVGIELGQLSVIAICFFAVTIWFKHKTWYRQRITIPASSVIALIGGYWFIERVFILA